MATKIENNWFKNLKLRLARLSSTTDGTDHDEDIREALLRQMSNELNKSRDKVAARVGYLYRI